LDHPGIVPVYDVGQNEDGVYYLVSKFIEGSDLTARITRGGIDPTEAVRIALDVALALYHAHQRGLVHRDIKPANLLLDTESRPAAKGTGWTAAPTSSASASSSTNCSRAGRRSRARMSANCSTRSPPARCSRRTPWCRPCRANWTAFVSRPFPSAPPTATPTP